jgi:hypothetical protein
LIIIENTLASILNNNKKLQLILSIIFCTKKRENILNIHKLKLIFFKLVNLKNKIVGQIMTYVESGKK